MIVTVLRSSTQVFWGYLSTEICMMSFSWSDWSCELLGRSRGKVLFSSHHTKGVLYQHDSSLLMLTLITWVEVVFVQFLLKVTLSPFLYCSAVFQTSALWFVLFVSSLWSLCLTPQLRRKEKASQGPLHYLFMRIQFSWPHFPCWIGLAPSSKIIWWYLWAYFCPVLRSIISFYWHRSVTNTAAVNFHKSPDFVIFFKDCSGDSYTFAFLLNYKIILSIYRKNFWVFNWDFIE